MTKADFNTVSKALFPAIGEAGMTYTGELNSPEHKAYMMAAHDRTLADLGWTPAEWKEELSKQLALSRQEMLARIERLQQAEQKGTK